MKNFSNSLKEIKVRGYDTPQLYREDLVERIRRLESEANDCAKRMNEIIRKGHLLEELVEEPFPPEDNDPDSE